MLGSGNHIQPMLKANRALSMVDTLPSHAEQCHTLAGSPQAMPRQLANPGPPPLELLKGARPSM